MSFSYWSSFFDGYPEQLCLRSACFACKAFNNLLSQSISLYDWEHMQNNFLSWITIHIISIDGNKCPIGIVLGDTSRELDLDYQSQIGNEVVHFLSRLPCWTSFVQQWKHSIFEKKIITMTCCLSLQPLIGTRVRIMRVLMNNLLSGDEQSVQHITTLETKYPNSLPHSNPCSSFTWPCQVLYWVLCVHIGNNEPTLFSGRRVWPGKLLLSGFN